MAGFVNRVNRVPYYQRLFQEGSKKHIRQWNQARGKPMLRVYYTTLIVSASGAMWMMGRMVLGHKSWWGK